MTDPNEQKSGRGKTFDMYHFFSRWDVLAAIVVVLLLLAYAVYSQYNGAITPSAV